MLRIAVAESLPNPGDERRFEGDSLKSPAERLPSPKALQFFPNEQTLSRGQPVRKESGQIVQDSLLPPGSESSSPGEWPRILMRLGPSHQRDGSVLVGLGSLPTGWPPFGSYSQ